MGLLLDNVLKGIHNSVIEAQKISEQQHMRALGRYFYLNKNKEKMEKEGVQIDDLGMPKSIEIKLPFAEGNKVNYKDVDIPLIALSPPSSLKIKGMKVSFEASLMGVNKQEEEKGFFKYFKNHENSEAYGSEDKTTKGPIVLDLSGGGGKKSGTAKIEIEFVNDDVPETFARINDHIVKSFPF